MNLFSGINFAFFKEMKSILLFISFILLAPCISWTNTVDFYVDAKVPSGPHMGEALETHDRRSIVDLTGSELETQLGKRVGYKLVGNIFHNNQHYIGYIPVGSANKTSLVLETFQTLVGHISILFEFDKPIELGWKIVTKQQKSDFNPTKNYDLQKIDTILLPEILFSMEGVPFENGPRFGIKSGVSKKLTASFRLTSLPGRMKDSMLLSKFKVRRFSTNFSSYESSEALKAGIGMAMENKMNKLYNLFIGNCAGTAFKILESGKPIWSKKAGWAKRFLQLIAVVIDYISPISEIFPTMAKIGIVSRGYKVGPFNGHDLYQERLYKKWLTNDKKDMRLSLNRRNRCSFNFSD